MSHFRHREATQSGSLPRIPHVRSEIKMVARAWRSCGGPSLKMRAGFPDGDLRTCRRQTVGHAVGPNHGQLRRASSSFVTYGRIPCPIFATTRFLSTSALYSPPFASLRGKREKSVAWKSNVFISLASWILYRRYYTVYCLALALFLFSPIFDYYRSTNNWNTCMIGQKNMLISNDEIRSVKISRMG